MEGRSTLRVSSFSVSTSLVIPMLKGMADTKEQYAEREMRVACRIIHFVDGRTQMRREADFCVLQVFLAFFFNLKHLKLSSSLAGFVTIAAQEYANSLRTALPLVRGQLLKFRISLQYAPYHVIKEQGRNVYIKGICGEILNGITQSLNMR